METVKIAEGYSEHDLVRKILEGEIGLFEILVRRNNAALYKIGRSYNYNHEDTEDLMQETFIDAYRSLRKFEGRSSCKTWLIKIMLSNCYRKRRKFSFKNELSSEISDRSIPMFSNQASRDTNNTVMNKELNFVIESALQSIPLEYRMVFALREINGLSIAESAEVLNISESNVKVRLNRAKAMLRKQMERFYTPQEIFEFNLVHCDKIVNNVMARILEDS